MVQVRFQRIAKDATWRTVRANPGQQVGDHQLNRLATVEAQRDRLMVRLWCLRGAIEAVRSKPASPQMRQTRTVTRELSFGEPRAYRALCFLVAPLDY